MRKHDLGLVNSHRYNEHKGFLKNIYPWKYPQPCIKMSSPKLNTAM